MGKAEIVVISLAVLAAFFIPKSLLQFKNRSRNAYPSTGEILRFDAAQVDKLIPHDANIEILVNGYVWTEGPLWVPHEDTGFLAFSDPVMNIISAWEPRKGLRVLLDKSGCQHDGCLSFREPGSNGLALNTEGELTICQHGERCIALLHANGTQSVLANRYNSKRLNTPNDLVYRSNGDLYFTDPPYGFKEMEESPLKEQPHNGVYLLRKGAVDPILVIPDQSKPNGVALSLRESKLYVANSDPDAPYLYSYALNADGTVQGPPTVLFNMSDYVARGWAGLPDGLKVDAYDNIWLTGPGGVYILTAEGTLIGALRMEFAVANVAWGYDWDDAMDRWDTYLYLTASSHICRLRVISNILPPYVPKLKALEAAKMAEQDAQAHDSEL
eukprot:GILJ01012240.1.p1 GENE.GILJ01012240.1~~GILJ01012240.1.p1  ORF type:complete len:385 (+),score=37.80 GILJ01012240.1:48-1202(+)